MAWRLSVKNSRFLALCIRRTPHLSGKICIKKCVLYKLRSPRQREKPTLSETLRQEIRYDVYVVSGDAHLLQLTSLMFVSIVSSVPQF